MSEKGFLSENCISQGTWKLLRSRARRAKVSFAVRKDRDTEGQTEARLCRLTEGISESLAGVLGDSRSCS